MWMGHRVGYRGRKEGPGRRKVVGGGSKVGRERRGVEGNTLSNSVGGSHS